MRQEVDTRGRRHAEGRARGALAVALSAAAFGTMPIFARQADATGVDLKGILSSITNLRDTTDRLALASVALRHSEPQRHDCHSEPQPPSVIPSRRRGISAARNAEIPRVRSG
jgi:hypothetical protein